MAENRYLGEYPVIGIRPIIDARRGPLKVRESLEEQTMGMAKAAKKLFEENLKYSNGEPVKVVISDTTIGRVAETAACAEQFKKEGVAITLSVTPCWCYGSETMDMDPNTSSLCTCRCCSCDNEGQVISSDRFDLQGYRRFFNRPRFHRGISRHES